MHADALAHGARVLIHDDLLATGGTARALAELVEQPRRHRRSAARSWSSSRSSTGGCAWKASTCTRSSPTTPTDEGRALARPARAGAPTSGACWPTRTRSRAGGRSCGAWRASRDERWTTAARQARQARRACRPAARGLRARAAAALVAGRAGIAVRARADGLGDRGAARRRRRRGSELRIELRQSPRGWAHFGGFMLRRAARRQLDEALDGMARAVERTVSREQKFWGWGEPGAGPRLPDHAAGLLREWLGVSGAVVAAPVALADVRLRAPVAVRRRCARRSSGRSARSTCATTARSARCGRPASPTSTCSRCAAAPPRTRPTWSSRRPITARSRPCCARAPRRARP